MRQGSFLPKYKCDDCGATWKRGGMRRPCPKCGSRCNTCVGLGFDGIMHQFSVMGGKP